MNWEVIDVLDFTEYLLQETLPLARRRNVTIVRKADPACPSSTQTGANCVTFCST